MRIFRHASLAAILAISSELAQAQRTKNSTVTGPNGNTASHTATRQKGSVQSSSTGPKGQTTNRNVSRQGGTTKATVAGPNGNTATRTSTITK
jgi:hypothetical protein